MGSLFTRLERLPATPTAATLFFGWPKPTRLRIGSSPLQTPAGVRHGIAAGSRGASDRFRPGDQECLRHGPERNSPGLPAPPSQGTMPVFTTSDSSSSSGWMHHPPSTPRFAMPRPCGPLEPADMVGPEDGAHSRIPPPFATVASASPSDPIAAPIGESLHP